MQNQDPVLNEAAKRLGVSLRQTEDELTRDMLMSTAAFLNCTQGGNGDNPTELTFEDVTNAISTLVTANAQTITSGIEGELQFGTSPIRDAFFAMASTEIIPDLEQCSGFVSKNNYPSSKNESLPSEWGSISNLRFMVSSIGAVVRNSSMNGADVRKIICAGMDAYAVVEQDGYSASFIYTPPYLTGPLALNCYAGWKAAMCPRILNDAWVLSLNCTPA